jgi:flagellar hook assembly protein FlgD
MPNPFSGSTRIQYSIPEFGHVCIQVFDMLGRRVKTLVDQEKEPGSYELFWNGTNSRSIAESSGVYLVRMQCGHFHAVKKVLLLK